MNNYVGINFGHDAGITVINNNIFTVLSERVNYFKQSAEITEEIFERALNLAKLNKEEINEIGISCTQGRAISYNNKSFIMPKEAYSLSGELMMFGDLNKTSNTYFGHFLNPNYNWKILKYPSRKSLIFENLKNKNISNIRNINLNIDDLVTKITAS